MKKAAIAWLLAALMLLLCGCASQTTNEDEGTTGQPGVSSDSEPGRIEAAPGENGAAGNAGGNGAGGSQGGNGSNLPQADGGGEAAGVPFDENGSGNNGGNGGAGNVTTTNNQSERDDTTKEGTTKSKSSDGVTMPRVPIPQH